jgi:ankyrin repeat protein
VPLIDSPEQLCDRILGLTIPYVDYRESVISAKGRRVAGTCEWIRNHESYRAWLNGDINLLWISGGPGKGKTMMSIFLTEDLEQNILTMQNTRLVYYFSSFQDENRNTGVTLLQSLIYQIVTKRPQLKNHLSPYAKPRNVQQPTLSLEPLWAIFKNLIKDPNLGTMLCVLDGLDESDKDAIDILLPRLVELLSPTISGAPSSAFRLVVVSRDIRGLENCTRVKLDPDNNESVTGDIESFISVRVLELSKVLGSHQECETAVRTTLLTRAEGTFLWVGFAMYELLQKKTWTEVFEALKTLPSSLPAIYSRMLRQIPAARQHNTSKILQWVTMALRPLSLLEPAAAIGLKSSSPLISLEHAMKDEILLCNSFLRVEDVKHSQQVTLIHQSVRDYLLNKQQNDDPVLESFRIEPNESHFELARTCLECVEQGGLQDTSLDMDELYNSRDSPLLHYAVLHWPEHMKSCPELAAKLFDPTSYFLRKHSHVRDRWWMLYRTTDFSLRFTSPPLLNLTCLLEIVPWVRIMVDKDRRLENTSSQIISEYPFDERNSDGETTLHVAAKTGNEVTVRLLVANGANVMAIDNIRSTVLHKASESGNENIVQIFLDKGVDVHALDAIGRSALHCAVRKDNEQTVELLLRHEADIHAVDLEGSTALHVAVSRRNEQIVQLLLRHGADTHVADSGNNTVLHWAAFLGSERMIQLLLDGGANAKAKNGFGATVQGVAKMMGHKSVIALLDAGTIGSVECEKNRKRVRRE